MSDSEPPRFKNGVLNPAARAAEKQRSRDEDQRRLDAGEVTLAELRDENNFFRGFDFTTFSIVAIGGKPLRRPIRRRFPAPP